MREIFGNNQNFDKMDNMNFTGGFNSRQPTYQQQQPTYQQQQPTYQQQQPTYQQQQPTYQQQQPTYQQQQPTYQQQQPTYQQQQQPQSTYTPRVKFMNEDENWNAKTTTTNPVRRQIYNAIVEYFPGFMMTKTNIYGKFSVYKSVASCLLCDGARYVVTIVKNDPELSRY